MQEAYQIATPVRTGLGAADKRVLLVLADRQAAGLPFPTVDEIALTKIVANRGAARNVMSALELTGVVARTEHGWASGDFTAVGRQLAAHLLEHRALVPDRQKRHGFKVWSPEMGLRTVHPTAVREVAAGENPFKDGRGIAKLGHLVTKGWLKGASIHYLTLEERATCPSTCALLDKCYGDSMVRAVRWAPTAGLETAIIKQLARWDRKRKRRLIRLHELGDFYTPSYVRLWDDALARYEWLSVFGYTAWPKEHVIGQAVAVAKARHGRRFSIRWSGSAGVWGSVVPGANGDKGDAFWCPEQQDRVPNCGACGACWGTTKAVAFKEH